MQHGSTLEQVVVFDLETVPDLEAYRRAEGLGSLSDAETLERLGDKFPKLPYHQIVCIGAVVSERHNEGWQVCSIGAPHCGERDEAAIISAFFDRVGAGVTTLVSFNGHSFDLPVLRYRAMLHGLTGGAFGRRTYFNRYAQDAIDLCDVLSSFDTRGKVGLDALSRIMGLQGKPEGISGKDVAAYVADGKIAEVAAYCETDVINTYRLWLRYELFSARLTQEQFHASEESLLSFISKAVERKPHLSYLIDVEVTSAADLGEGITVTVH